MGRFNVGDTITGFIRENTTFHAGRGKTPLILIGAGIGPLAGMIRGNTNQRPMHPHSDYLYDDDLPKWQTTGQLTTLITATSRSSTPHYEQDALRTEGDRITTLLQNGARIMVCDGRDISAGVAAALGEILTPLGMSPLTLKAQRRYVEDIY